MNIATILFIGVLLYCHVVTSRSFRGSRSKHHALDSSTLLFSVCNGFSNQRLAIVYAAVIAKASHRSLVVPRLLLDGEEHPEGEHVEDSAASSVPFEHIYNLTAFQQELWSVNVTVLSAERAPSASEYTSITLEELAEATPDLTSYHSVKHLQIQCPLWVIPSKQMLQEAEIIKAVLAGLQPSQALLRYVDAASHHLKGLSSNHAFNVLHLRLEPDWIAFCKRQSDNGGGIVHNNCLNNTFSLAPQLISKGLLPETPLYVSLDWSAADQVLLDQALAGLIYKGYNIILKHETLNDLYALPRQLAASVSYFISMNSKRFIGNSVSTFSALCILERRINRKWASHYNGGNIPLAAEVPLYALPWVFTYNSWSQDYEYMLKPAVISARSHGTLHPMCVFSGDTESHIFRWLSSHGVQMVVRNPAWAGMLEKRLNNSAENVHHSHLYATSKMAVGTWQRIDVPLLPQVSQYEYILFTDSDVFFRKPVTLESFNLPLPLTIGMAPEGSDEFPFNAGVMLINVPALRTTYPAFTQFVFSNEHGMFFPNYGPVDQGAYNQFYEATVREGKLPGLFNAKPYQPFNHAAAIVHWHGPKPVHFIKFLQSGRCPFRHFEDMCTRGLENSYCQYLREWAFYAESHVASQLRIALMKCPVSASNVAL